MLKADPETNPKSSDSDTATSTAGFLDYVSQVSIQNWTKLLRFEVSTAVL